MDRKNCIQYERSRVKIIKDTQQKIIEEQEIKNINSMTKELYELLSLFNLYEEGEKQDLNRQKFELHIQKLDNKKSIVKKDLINTNKRLMSNSKKLNQTIDS